MTTERLKIDPSKIDNKFALATVITLVFEGLFLIWFFYAETSNERIIAGILSAILLVIFLYLTFKENSAELSEQGKKLIGEWEINSISTNNNFAKGIATISNTKSGLSINGYLQDAQGRSVGSFESKVTRINENRLIFYYQYRDHGKTITMDAVSILIYITGIQEELRGDWIVASKEPRHGTVTYTRVKN